MCYCCTFEALLRCNAVMYVLDPKNADLADLSVVMPEVYYKKEDITACIDKDEIDCDIHIVVSDKEEKLGLMNLKML